MSLSLVIPILNEAENIDNFIEKVVPIIEKITNIYELIFVLDPCTDDSEEIILKNIKKNENIKLIKFSRRFGQPAALLAGIKNSSLENIILIDVDLQDPQN